MSRAPSQHGLERVRRVRVVDQHRERLAGLDRLQPARHAGTAAMPAAMASQRHRPERARIEAAASTLATLKRAAQAGLRRRALAGGRDEAEPRAAGLERAGRSARTSAPASTP